jgi:AbrB family looped-hinge helix DNA binding protein
LSKVPLYVEVGKNGRIVLPKGVRERYGVAEKTRLLIREREGEIVFIPLTRYDNPTDALYGSVKPDKPIDSPKETARLHVRRRLTRETAR